MVINTVYESAKKYKILTDLCKKTTDKCKTLVSFVADKYPDNEAVQRLSKGYNPQKIMETLPTSQYTAYSRNKGEKLAFLSKPVNRKGGTKNDLIDEHTLMFVTIHELAHIMTKSIGHKTGFGTISNFCYKKQKTAAYMNPKDYKEPREYCSIENYDNPYFDA